jgi:hypothetical protein
MNGPGPVPLAEELLHAIQQVIALGLGDVQQGDHLAVEGVGPRRAAPRHRHGIGRIQEFFAHSAS